MIAYRIQATHPAAHRFTVQVTVPQPAATGQIFALPVWIPGSYMVREFARHLSHFSAQASGKTVPLTQLDKHRWQAAPCQGALTLTYTVYAWDLSVRAAHLDTTHGFFNGTSVFVYAEGWRDAPCRVDIVRPAGEAYKSWRVATSLPEATGKGAAKRYGFGAYQADNYDELVDHPVEMGDFQLATFTAHGVPHDVVITGHVPKLDMLRLTTDLQAICERQIALFEPRSKQAPMSRYVFLTQVTPDGYGGLEHRASTALLCSRDDLPVLGQSAISEGYQTYLGLCSHEYFHTWNVKRIKPAAFVHYDYSRENYTRLLWLFEGFTSYYDDLMLVRSGRITPEAYLKLLEKNLNTVLRGHGRTQQSVADSSFDAWTKYYRQDENAPNTIVSYYAKGALIALGLDAKLRTATQGQASLDDVMRTLWQRYGRDFYHTPTPQGLAEDGFAECVQAALGKHFTPQLGAWLKRYLAQCVAGTDDVPLKALLKPLGIALTSAKPSAKSNVKAKADLGIKTSNANGWVKITHVQEGGAALSAGLAAGDVLIALDGLRVQPSTLEKRLAVYGVGDKVSVIFARQDEIQHSVLEFGAPAITMSLRYDSPQPHTNNRLQVQWLQAI